MTSSQLSLLGNRYLDNTLWWNSLFTQRLMTSPKIAEKREKKWNPLYSDFNCFYFSCCFFPFSLIFCFSENFFFFVCSLKDFINKKKIFCFRKFSSFTFFSVFLCPATHTNQHQRTLTLLCDEKTLKLKKERNIYLSTQLLLLLVTTYMKSLLSLVSSCF